MNIERLVAMANDIAAYFSAEPNREDGVAGVAAHLKRFWEPRMLRAIAAHVAAGGAGLSDLARDAVLRLP